MGTKLPQTSLLSLCFALVFAPAAPRALAAEITFEKIKMNDLAAGLSVQLQWSWHAIGIDPSDNVYVVFGGPDGESADCALFQYHAANGTRRLIGTLSAVAKAAGTWREGERIEKGHTHLPWLDGKLYIGTMGFHDASAESPREMALAARSHGAHLMAYDPAIDAIEDLSRNQPDGVFFPQRGFMCLTPMPEAGLIVGLTVPHGDLLLYDPAKREPRTIVPGVPEEFGRHVTREVVCAPNGRIYYMYSASSSGKGPGHMYYYDTKTGTRSKAFDVDPGYWNGSVRVKATGAIYLLTDAGYVYQLHPDTARVERIGSLYPESDRREVEEGENLYLPPHLLGMALSADETGIYSIPLRKRILKTDRRPHMTGDTEPRGPQVPFGLFRFDLATRTAKRVADVGPEIGFGYITGTNIRDSRGNLYFAHHGGGWVGLVKVNTSAATAATAATAADAAIPPTRPAADAASATRTAAAEAAVLLSPFEVTAVDDGSYLATHTLAGTRFNTELKDVPASLSVMTADFLRDIGANNLNDAMAYTVGAENEAPSNNGNNLQGSDLQLNMRGFTNSVLGRNYFQSQTAQDNYNMERATFSRGPNSVLFGSGGAGGIADATTKRAQQRSITQFTNRVGGFDDYRFEIDLNRAITRTLAVRLNALYWTKKGWRDFEHMDRRSAALAATWRPFERTTIRIDTEYGKVDELKPQPWPALDAVTGWISNGRPVTPATSAVSATKYYISNSNQILNPYNRVTSGTGHLGAEAGGLTVFKDQSIVPFARNVMGPGATTNNDFLNAGVFLEQQLSQNLFLEAAANQQHVHRDWNRAMQWTDARVYADPNSLLPDGTANPFGGQYFIQDANRPSINHTDQTWNDYRVTATYKFNLGWAGEHQVAGLVSRRDFFNRGNVRTEAWANNPAQPNLTVAANTITRRTYVSFDGTGNLPSYFPDPFNTPINVNGVTTRLYRSSMTDTLSRFDSEVATLQSRFFKSRLVTTLGLRRDAQSSWGSGFTRDPVTQEVLSAFRDADSNDNAGNTRTAGAVLHLLPWVSLAANTSSNATPQGFVAFGPDATNRNITLGNRTGEGMDLGLRFRLFDERFHGSVTYFETNEQNSQRYKAGDTTSGWELWLNRSAIALNKPGAFGAAGGEGGYFTGEDTVDVRAHGWETEWTINVNRSLRLMFNGTRTIDLGANQFPRVTAVAQALLVEMRASPNTPVTGVNNATTLGAVAALMETQIGKDHRTEGKLIARSRPYSGNVVVNYRFTEGLLKGVAVTAGVNARGRRVIGYNTVTNEPVMDGDYTQLNVSLSYSRPVTVGARRLNWSVTLAGTNVLGNRYGLLPTIGDEFGIDRYTFETTPTVFLTNRFSF